MSVISVSKKKLLLNSGILEENYGKMNYSSVITEEGILINATKKDDGYDFSTEKWNFEEVSSIDTENGRFVHYIGKAPFFTKKAATLLEIFESEDSEENARKKWDAGFLILSLITDFALNSPETKINGAGGIVLEFKSNGDAVILILPCQIFSYAIAGLTQAEKSLQSELWLNPTLIELKQLCFMRGILAYKMLTGQFPYPSTDTIARNADIFDKKFLPVDLCVSGIDERLSEEINNSLFLNDSSSEPEKVKRINLKRKIEITANPEFPLKEMANSQDKARTSNSPELESKRRDFLKLQESKVNTKRAIRRNIPKIVACSAIAIVLIVLIANSVKTNRENPTSKGLTSEQTVEAFFKGINSQDTILVSNLSEGKSASRYSDIVSNIYVISKNRQAYNNDMGFLSPSAYFLYLGDDYNTKDAGLYGITNLKINGNSKIMDLKIFEIREKPAPVTEEKNIQLYDKLESVVTAEYDILHSEGAENLIMGEHHKDLFTLTYKRDKWVITDISTLEQSSLKINDADFTKDFLATLEIFGGDHIQATKTLKTIYTWLPSKQEMENEVVLQKSKELEFLRSYGLAD